MSSFILHFCNKGELSAESGCEGYLLAFGQLADDFAVGVLAHHSNQVFPLVVRHPIAGLDFFATGYPGFKIGEVLVGRFFS